MLIQVLGEKVFSLCLRTASGRGISFHQLGAKTVKSFDACLLCIVRYGGPSQAVLEVQTENSAEYGVPAGKWGLVHCWLCRQAYISILNLMRVARGS